MSLRLRFQGLAALLLLLALPAAAARWVELSPTTGPMPAARTQAGSVYDPYGHRMIVFGGRPGFDDIWAFDLTTHTWEDLSPAAGAVPPARWTPVLVIDPAAYRVVMWSGQGSGFFNDTWAFDLATNTWTQLFPADPKPLPRYGAAGVRDPRTGELVSFAGFTTSGRFEDTWRFDAERPAWAIDLPAVNPGRRCLHSASYDIRGHRMIVYAGQRSGALDDIWAYDLVTEAWNNLTPATRPAGRFFTAHAYDGRRHRALIFGGNLNTTRSGDVWAFDLAHQSWSEVEPEGAGPTARDGATAIYIPHEDRMVLFGGFDTAERNDVWSIEFGDPAGIAFPDQVVADATGFSWPLPLNVDWVSGPLGAVASYDVDRGGALVDATRFDDALTPLPGEGWYYLFRPQGPSGSWQTTPGAQPGRDAVLDPP